MELLAEVVNSLKLLSISVKRFILDDRVYFWQGSEHASKTTHEITKPSQSM